jgi:hypothetical protein
MTEGHPFCVKHQASFWVRLREVLSVAYQGMPNRRHVHSNLVLASRLHSDAQKGSALTPAQHFKMRNGETSFVLLCAGILNAHSTRPHDVDSSFHVFSKKTLNRTPLPCVLISANDSFDKRQVRTV